MNLESLPVDLFADPDGDWEYEALVRRAGFDPEASPAPLVGALLEPWFGHPEGAAVVAGAADDAPRPLLAVVECAAQQSHRAA